LTGEIVRCDDSENDDRVDREACRRVGARSMVVVPLKRRAATVGVLKVFSPQPKAFDEEDVRTLQLMAGLVGSVLAQAAEYDEKQNLLLQRTQAMESLRESEERFRLLAESAFEGIAISIDGIIKEVNQEFCRMFGYQYEDVIGRHAMEFAEPDSRTTVSTQIITESETLYQTTGLRKDGSTFDIEIWGRRIHLNGRKARVAAVRDITERRRIEQMKDEFIAVVNHELRTPLTSIHGALGLMVSGVAGPLTATGQSMSEVAHRNAQRLLNLINDLLDIQKIEAGKMTFTLGPVEFNALIANSVQSMEGYGATLDVRFEFEAGQNPIWLHSDADRLTQVMVNLLSNAAKFSPSAGVVQVAIKESAGEVRVEVRDYGTGIPLDFQSRIFQKFAQADASSTRAVNGTGLGLSICKAILDNLGGTIGFETQPGHGTTFYFELPMAPETSNRIAAV
jgi:PAS domain S-box-containing protein